MNLNKNPLSSGNLPYSLSSREAETLFFIASGFNNSQIAEELNISKNTIRVHRRNLYWKLQVKKSAGAIMKGFQLGYLM